MLTKLHRTVYFPAVPGQPEVPYVPGYTVCGSAPATGEWRQVCSTVRIPLSDNDGVLLPPGTVSTTYVTEDGKTYVDCYVCRSEWVETGSPGEPTCVTYPEQPYQPGQDPVPARVEQVIDFAWNAGANSHQQVDGDAVLRLRMRKVVGVVVGLTGDREHITELSRLPHALYFHQSAGGGALVSVMELGRRITEPADYDSVDQWEIRRIGTAITYWRNGEVFYRSTVTSAGQLSAGCVLYATNDTIPTGVEFQALTVTHGSGQGSLQVALRAVGYDSGLVALGNGLGSFSLRLSAAGSGYGYDAGEIEPAIPAHGTAGLPLAVSGMGYGRGFGDGAARLALRAQGYGVRTGQGAGEALIRLRLQGQSTTAPMGYGLLVRRPSEISGFGDHWFLSMRERLLLATRMDRLPVAVVRDVIALQAARAPRYEGTLSAHDSIAFSERLHRVLRLLIEERIILGGTVDAEFDQVARVISRLVLGGQAQHVAEALAMVLDGLVFASTVQSLERAELQDAVVLGDTIGALYRAVARALETLVLGDRPTLAYTAMILVQERLVLGARLSHEADLTALVRDSIGFMATLTIDNGEYIAWVLNAESKGLSRYTNYPFNSFAKIGGRYYGAAADGLHRLDGDDDNGVKIKASIRLGLSALGTRRLKRIPDAFIGYSSSGVLLLKAITINEKTGEKEASIYRLAPRGAANTRENRFQLGRGLKSVDWDFEIENVDGADFDIASIEFRSLLLDRRTRG